MPLAKASGDYPSAPSWRSSRFGFYLGVLLVTFGVLLQLPDVRVMIDHARLKADADLPSGAPGMESMDASEGMSMWTPTMLIGMLLLLVGFFVAAQSLFRGTRPSTDIAGIGVESIEHGRLRPIYWATAAVLTVALVVDVMKPLTLGFVLPGMGQEYDMPLEAVTILPLVALTGTAVGSVVWGLLGDRFGRRSALLLATLLFIATSACGAMPSFEWNLVMCFVMGSSAGGLLPLVFTLVAELTPRRHRGWVAVTVGSIGGLGGYLAASEAAHLLEPSLTWRALWLIGLPTGLLLLVLAPLVPESPLFLLRAGRHDEAKAILERYGSHLDGSTTSLAAGDVARPGMGTLLRTYPAVTAVIGVVGLFWGLVNFGFLVMLPAQLHEAGMAGGAASGVLAKSALYSAPALVLVVFLYAGWSGRRALALFVGATGVALSAMAIWAEGAGGQPLLVAAIALLVLSLSAVNAMLLPYSAEIYPTAMRATGSGFAGAATKFGGILGPSAMLLILALHDGLAVPAVALTVLCGVSLLLLLRFGPEVHTSFGRRPRRSDKKPAQPEGPTTTTPVRQ